MRAGTVHNTTQWSRRESIEVDKDVVGMLGGKVRQLTKEGKGVIVVDVEGFGVKGIEDDALTAEQGTVRGTYNTKLPIEMVGLITNTP